MRVEGVILAAGYSSRIGSNKMLLQLGGKSILERCWESMAPVCSRVIVVGGYRIEELQSVIKPSYGLKLVFNECYSTGMFSSVQKGIREVKEEKFFLCPGDYPLIQKQTYRKLLSIQAAIVVPTYQGRPGHPVLITSSFIQDILGGSYSSLKHFINANNPQFVDSGDPGIHLDIDTIEDYEKAARQFYEGLGEGIKADD